MCAYVCVCVCVPIFIYFHCHWHLLIHISNYKSFKFHHLTESFILMYYKQQFYSITYSFTKFHLTSVTLV